MPDLSGFVDACLFATGSGLPTGEPTTKPLVYFDETSGEFHGWLPGGSAWESLSDAAGRRLKVVPFVSSTASVSMSGINGQVYSAITSFPISNAGRPSALPLFLWAESKIEGYALTKRPEISASAYVDVGDTFGVLVNKGGPIVFLEPSASGAMSSATSWTPIFTFSPEGPIVVPAGAVLTIRFQAVVFTREAPPNAADLATATVRLWALGYRR